MSWAATGVTPEQVLDDPYMFIGRVEHLVETLQRRRELYGISYLHISFQDIECVRTGPLRTSQASDWRALESSDIMSARCGPPNAMVTAVNSRCSTASAGAPIQRSETSS